MSNGSSTRSGSSIGTSSERLKQGCRSSTCSIDGSTLLPDAPCIPAVAIGKWRYDKGRLDQAAEGPLKEAVRESCAVHRSRPGRRGQSGRPAQGNRGWAPQRGHPADSRGQRRLLPGAADLLLGLLKRYTPVIFERGAPS